MKIKYFMLLLLVPFKIISLEIPDASLAISFPEMWKYFGKEGDSDFYSYQYKRSPIKNDDGEPIIPTLSIYIQKNNNKVDTLTYLSKMRSALGLIDKVEITLIDSEEGYFKLPFAVGVIGRGIPKNYEREMTLILLVFEYGDYCTSIICACTKDVYLKVEKEYIDILNSIILKTEKKVINFVRTVKGDNIVIFQPEVGIGMVLKKANK